MEPLWLALLLFVATAALVAMELVLPGGVLGVMAAVAAVGGVAACFAHSHAAGAASLVGLVVLGPAGWVLYVRNVDRVFGARNVVLGPGDAATAVPPVPLLPGQPGFAVSELRPGGVCDFAGRRVPARSETGLVPVGSTVRVVSYADGRAVVRAV
ncbi:MAG: hypothetical protein JWO31_208 [Phycisphaerales bacterium]|nr:hypothetical protein [Phycisphaerales bacterium]